MFVVVIESKHKIFPFNENQKLFNPLSSLFIDMKELRKVAFVIAPEQMLMFYAIPIQTIFGKSGKQVLSFCLKYVNSLIS